MLMFSGPVTFFLIRVFIYQNSRFTGQQGMRKAISVALLYHFLTSTIAERLLLRAHLCNQLAARIKSGTFGFRAQVANHASHGRNDYKCKCYISLPHSIKFHKLTEFHKHNGNGDEKLQFFYYCSQILRLFDQLRSFR